jgi:hypothetical protein
MTEDKAMREQDVTFRAYQLYQSLKALAGSGGRAHAQRDLIASEFLAIDKAGYQRGMEEAAKIADGFGCGACGMDGKAGAAIRRAKTESKP